MTEIPRHREADPIEVERGDAHAQSTRSWVVYVLGAVVAAVFVLVVVLHLIGVVGPGAH